MLVLPVQKKKQLPNWK